MKSYLLLPYEIESALKSVKSLFRECSIKTVRKYPIIGSLIEFTVYDNTKRLLRAMPEPVAVASHHSIISTMINARSVDIFPNMRMTIPEAWSSAETIIEVVSTEFDLAYLQNLAANLNGILILVARGEIGIKD